MVTESELKNIISKVLKEIEPNKTLNSNERYLKNSISQGSIPDITEEEIQNIYELKNSVNKEEFLKYKKKTPARVGASRAGSRYTTKTSLRFKADHAAAIDAVFSDVEDDFLERNNLFKVSTMCKNRDEYLTRPDLGRKISKEGKELINEKCTKGQTVQIYVADGLSSTAVKANIENLLPSLLTGLKVHGIDVGTTFFVKYGRVGTSDEVSELIGSQLTCLLIGERPGLATAESMSAYITYKGYVGIPEAKRTVVSNIHKNGTPSTEAGAHIADIIKKSLDAKASGQDLKL